MSKGSGRNPRFIIGLLLIAYAGVGGGLSVWRATHDGEPGSLIIGLGSAALFLFIGLALISASRVGRPSVSRSPGGDKARATAAVSPSPANLSPSASSNMGIEQASGCLVGVLVLAVPIVVVAQLARRWSAEGSTANAFVALGVIVAVIGLTVVVAFLMAERRRAVRLTVALGGAVLVMWVGVYIVAAPDQRPSAAVIDAVGPLCRGETVVGAGSGDASDSSSTVVVLARDGTAHSWVSKLPASWRPQSVEDVDFVACADDPAQYRRIETCGYVDGPAVVRYAATMAITLVAAKTGEVVTEQTLQALPRLCAQREQRSLTRLDGELEPSALVEFLSQFLEAPS